VMGASQTIIIIISSSSSRARRQPLPYRRPLIVAHCVNRSVAPSAHWYDCIEMHDDSAGNK